MRGAVVLGLALLSVGCGSAVETEDESASGSTTAPVAGTSSTGPMAESSTGGVVSTSSSSSGAEEADSSSGTTGTTGDTTTGVTPVDDPGCPDCIVLVDLLEGGRGLTLDATHVYFTDQSQGTVSRIMKSGGDGGVLVEGQESPYDIAVDDTHVYWTNFVAGGAVMRALKDGTQPEVIANANRPRPVAVDDTSVYWATFDGDGLVFRRDLALSGPDEQIANLLGGVPDLIVGSDAGVYYTAHAEAGGAFIVDPTEEPVGGVFTTSLEGKIDPFNPTALVASQAQPWGIASAPNGQLVWANGGGIAQNNPNAIMRMTVGEPPTVLANSASPWGIAADAEFVYWTDNDRVLAVPLGGGDVTELANTQNSARMIAVDDDSVFWITRNRVLQRPKL